MADLTLAIDGGALVGGLAAAGTAIGGGIVAAIKLLVAYLKSKDAAMNKLIDRFLGLSASWQNESRQITAALTQLVDRIDRLDSTSVNANKRPYPADQATRPAAS